MNDTCRAGVNYDEVRKQGQDLPCFKDRTSDSSCDKCSWHTDEEVAAQVKAHEEHTKVMFVVIPALKEDAKKKGFKKGNGGASSITCPNCGGTVSYRVSGYNGHMHAMCSSPTCVHFME
jgi:hypothetical protein